VSRWAGERNEFFDLMKNYRELNFTLFVNLVADDNEVLMVCEDFCLCLGDAVFSKHKSEIFGIKGIVIWGYEPKNAEKLI